MLKPGATEQAERTPTQTRSGWWLVVAFVVLHFAIALSIPAGPRRSPTAGDPMALWVGLLFLLWGSAFALSPRAEHVSVLFRFLNGRQSGFGLGLMFLGAAAWLLATWAGLLG